MPTSLVKASLNISKLAASELLLAVVMKCDACRFFPDMRGMLNNPGTSCLDIFEAGIRENGVYYVKIDGKLLLFFYSMPFCPFLFS